MAKMTPERRKIRQHAEDMRSMIEHYERRLRQSQDQLSTLQEQCGHPAVKHGHAGGMSYSDCPDCGWSQP